MIGDAALISVLSALVFGALVLMTDRPKGALLSQAGSAIAAAVIFGLIAVGDGIAAAPLISATAVAFLAATTAAMFYHLYLGRFTSVWAARSVFAGVYLAIAGAAGFFYLSFR